MASNPKSRINSDESLTKVFNRFADLAGEVEPGLHVSWGNSKMGCNNALGAVVSRRGLQTLY